MLKELLTSLTVVAILFAIVYLVGYLTTPPHETQDDKVRPGYAQCGDKVLPFDDVIVNGGRAVIFTNIGQNVINLDECTVNY